MMRAHGPRPRPLDPGGELPAAAAARGPAAPRLQPALGVAPARPAACSSLIDRTAWTRYRNPIPVISGPTDWSRLLDDAKFLAEYHDVLADFDQYMANGSDHWFQRSTPTRCAARSPTSAPSTASTSRWASTRAASASSPATT